MSKIVHKPVPSNFKYPVLKAEDYRFGSSPVKGVILRPDGDWRDYLPVYEDQRKNGVESSACYIEAQQHTIATLLEEQYGIKDQDFSSRFNALLSDGTEEGGSPTDGAQSIRHDGLVRECMLPFSGDITSWEEFHSWKGGDEKACREAGKEWLGVWAPRWDIVFEREESVKSKYAKIREALKCGPLPVSVNGWYQNGDVYVKPPKSEDNHFVELVYLDEDNHPYILDTYAPYIKKLERYYNFDLGIRWTLERREVVDQKISLIEKIINIIKKLIPFIEKKEMGAACPAPMEPRYLWDEPILARHSVRVICDEEQLTVEEKNTLCATVGAESGWKPDAMGPLNKNGTRDWGIVQVNSGLWIGPGKQFPSIKYVLDNPESCIRWMCKQWKLGRRSWWIGYSGGNYKHYL